MTAALLLALTAGMLGAVNPCGFALLPAYLSLLVAGTSDTRGAVGRALTAAAGLTSGVRAGVRRVRPGARAAGRLAAAPAAVADRGARRAAAWWPAAGCSPVGGCPPPAGPPPGRPG